MPTAAVDMLEANLARLARTEPELAARIHSAEPAPLAWSASRAGPFTATIEHEGKLQALGSRYDPAAEAEKLLAAVDYQKHAGVFILGMGLGYHVAEAARRMSRDCLLVVFEPDSALLRAVFERLDHSAWLGRPNVILADSALDRAGLVQRIERFAALVTQGTVLVVHPPTRQRAPEAVAAFGQMVTDALAYCRTNVATSLVNSARTIRNLSLNLPYYAAGANTNELHGAARGYPAVCVGAGPSLANNVHLLADPAVRRNVVVISAQTTLKPLLERGIEPDFVTALDYSEISARFYENLPALERVTLVAEPKAHPTVLDGFPGPMRVTNNGFLDRLLGELAVPVVPIASGATVAHLSFYLAQHLGCDPVIFIGQDLGFSDGLYYCPGTAIHDVWAPELGPFNTLEMMEWQRIVRHRHHLQRLEDVHGRAIYSDEQMLTYLKQFERDFAAAKETLIDATEGGLAKAHAKRMTLAEALAQHATRPAPPLSLPPRGLDAGRLAAAAALLRRRAGEVAELQRIARKTLPILQQMREHQRDKARMERLFGDLDRQRRRVEALQETFGLVNSLNTIGAFKRARADRAIEHAGTSEPDKQQRQIERDLENLDWMVQSCDEAQAIFQAALERTEALFPSPPGRGCRSGAAAEAGEGARGLALVQR